MNLPPSPSSQKIGKTGKVSFLDTGAETKLDQEAGSVQRDALIFYMGTKQAEQIMATFTWGKIRVPDPARVGQAIEVE